MLIEWILLTVVLTGALLATGIFLYGAWKLVRSASLPERVRALIRALGFSREERNPILEAREQSWERGGVMNPAVLDAGGKTHMFYRAVGADGVSRVGYATLRNGTEIDERLPYPVFALQGIDPNASRSFAFHSGLMASGGGFAGVEDPRAVLIDDRVYLTFSAFAGWESLRMAVSSIRLDDLLKKRWQWTPPVYLSKPGEVHKNWVLFPEKIRGNFSILHAFDEHRREAHIHELETLEKDPSPYLESNASFRGITDQNVWDSKMRGAGPPPLKTEKGWLVFYHANDLREPHRYKVGALLLDLLNPRHVLARAPVPILEPDAWYENHGKPGIVYACGATCSGDTLRLYYGGADAVICSATASLSSLLSRLVPPSRVPFMHPSAYALT